MRKIGAIAILMASLGFLTACDKEPEDKMESAAESMEEAAENTGDAMEDAGEAMEDKMNE